MSASDWINVLLGTVQAGATVMALYFAWRTVKEAKVTQADFRRERVSRQLGQIAEVVGDLELWIRSASGIRTEENQVRLRALLSGADVELPKTKRLSEMTVIGAGYMDAGIKAAEEARAELQAARDAQRSDT